MRRADTSGVRAQRLSQLCVASASIGFAVPNDGVGCDSLHENHLGVANSRMRLMVPRLRKSDGAVMEEREPRHLWSKYVRHCARPLAETRHHAPAVHNAIVVPSEWRRLRPKRR